MSPPPSPRVYLVAFLTNREATAFWIVGQAGRLGNLLDLDARESQGLAERGEPAPEPPPRAERAGDPRDDLPRGADHAAGDPHADDHLQANVFGRRRPPVGRPSRAAGRRAARS